MKNQIKRITKTALIREIRNFERERNKKNTLELINLLNTGVIVNIKTIRSQIVDNIIKIIRGM